MKTADLSANEVYSFVENTYSAAKPTLLLDTTTWAHAYDWGYWGGSKVQSREYTWRRSGGRPGKGRRYGSETIGLPILVLDISDSCFIKGQVSPENEIVETPAELLGRAASQMRVRDLVSEDHDGRAIGGINYRTEVEAKTANGGTRTIGAVLHLVRPQVITAKWDLHVVEAEKLLIQESKWAKEKADKKAESDRQAADFAARVSALLGDSPSRSYDGERYDCHRKYSSTGTSNTYEVDASVLERLLGLAEKGASA